MNPIVKAQLKEFRKSNPSEKGDDAHFFEILSILAVENGRLGENIDPFKAHLKGNEFGVDGLAILIQGELCADVDEAESVLSIGRQHSGEFHFFQSKISEKMDYGNIAKFLDAVYDFFDENKLLKGEQIEDLLLVKDKLIGASAKSNPILKCFYCTSGGEVVSSEIAALIEASEARLSALNIFGEVSIECVGAKGIQNGYRAATNSTSATISFPKAVTLPFHDKVEEAFIGYVSADQILEIVLSEPDENDERHINRSVFYDNVRDFDASSEINKSIVKELEGGDFDSFVFKNNGVTVVAKSISRKGDSFNIEDYQIVNGCQTTNILSLIPGSAKEVYVPLRLIGSKDLEFVSSIIVGTNKQNEVREDQFWALLPFMKDLEEFSASQEPDEKILIERRENQYREVAVERTRIIKPSDLMKVAVAMFFAQPHRVARDYRSVIKDYSDSIFKDDHSVELYHVAALAHYRFEYFIRNSKIDRRNKIYKFYILYSLIRMYEPSKDIFSLSKKSHKSIREKVLPILLSNDAFEAHVNSVSMHLNDMVRQAEIGSREKIRDYIRKESVFEMFVNSYFSASSNRVA